MSAAKPKITLTLPALDAYDALLLVDALESIISALWKTHGDHMADIRARQGIDTPAPKDAVWSGNPNPTSDPDLDF